jgi:predicted membrane protein
MLLSFVISFTILGTLFVISHCFRTCIMLASFYEEHNEEEEPMTPEAQRMYV